MPGRPSLSREALVERLARATSDGSATTLLAGSPAFHDQPFALALADEVPRRGRIDLRQAERLAVCSRWLADRLGDDYARARSQRAVGHLYALRGDWTQALGAYQTAIARFERLRRDVEIAITLSGGLQALIYRGDYTEAESWVRRARSIFRRHRDTLRLARLDSNAGNIYYRQDRFADALRLYRRAYTVFRRGGHAQDAAVTLRNMAGCYASMDAFDQAIRTHRIARAYCAAQQLPLLVAEADYNIAYLYYMRGDYAHAIDLYRDTRELCRRIGDRYHRALCDLDQSELYLELNLQQEGTALATSALSQFRSLRLTNESAKATVNLAIAAGRQGQHAEALALFGQARVAFEAEANPVWPALIDLYEAHVLLQGVTPDAARAPVERARVAFERMGLTSRAMQCDLMLARLDLDEGAPAAAESRCQSVLSRLDREHSPGLAYQAHLLLGAVHEARGQRVKAQRAYLLARDHLEQLRSHVRGDQFRVAFLRDKLAVYDAMLALELSGSRRSVAATAFALVEQAKSRSLSEMLALRTRTGSVTRGVDATRRRRVERLRLDLAWVERQLAEEELKGSVRSESRRTWLRERARSRERDLSAALLELSSTDGAFADLEGTGTVDLQTFQRALPDDTTVVEYFEARGVTYALVIARGAQRVHRLARTEAVVDRIRLLQFQLSKFRLGDAYVTRQGPALAQATRAHLRALYEALLAPLRSEITTSRLVILPHGPLHHLPFHALVAGDRAVIDDLVVSYAPSASVLYHAWKRPATPTQGALVMGVPDAGLPFVKEEVTTVARQLRGSRVRLGRQAGLDALRRLGRRSRVIHIATHGFFRQDNPLFSSVRLGSGPLSLFELYDLDIRADLVTLSGCGTGLSVQTGGDELIGLVRGWLYAGARSVLVTLWDANDRSTATFMGHFYRALAQGLDRAAAVRTAMLALREEHPHPYYWAPFTLVGQVQSPSDEPASGNRRNS